MTNTTRPSPAVPGHPAFLQAIRGFHYFGRTPGGSPVPSSPVSSPPARLPDHQPGLLDHQTIVFALITLMALMGSLEHSRRSSSGLA